MINGGEDLEDRLGTLWDILNATKAMSNIDVPEDFACFMRLYIVTLARPGEIARVDTSQFDLERGRWTVPSGKRSIPPRVVPLSPYAISLVHRATGIRDNAEGGAIFPVCRNASGVTSVDASSRRFKRLALALSWADFSLMDIRRSCHCLLLSISDEHQGPMIDLVLGHRKRMLDRHFHRIPGMVDVCKALDAWETRLADITGDHRLTDKRPALPVAGDGSDCKTVGPSEAIQPGGLSRPV